MASESDFDHSSNNLGSKVLGGGPLACVSTSGAIFDYKVSAAPADSTENNGLQYFATSAAFFMVMQARWLQTITDGPEFDGPTAAAFAYGVWDSVTQRYSILS